MCVCVRVCVYACMHACVCVFSFCKPSFIYLKDDYHIFIDIFSHPPKRRRVTYASGIRPASASASTLCTSYMKPLHEIISYCKCILV